MNIIFLCASTILQYFINLLWYFEMWMDWKTFAYTLYFCYLVWIKSICIRIWLLFWPFLVSSNWTFDNTDFRTEMTKSSKRGNFWGVECQISGRINQSMVDDWVPGGWLVAKWAIWRDPTWSVPGITTNYNSISPDYPRDLLLTRIEGIKNWGKMVWLRIGILWFRSKNGFARSLTFCSACLEDRWPVHN